MWPSARSSVSEMCRPRVRNAVSRRRCSSVANSKSSVSKISASGQERDRRAGLLGGRALRERALRRAADVVLGQREAVAPDLDVELLRERVDDRDADAVQAAGHLVAAAVAELAAGVQHGQHDLDRRLALLLHRRDRDAAAVVDDRDRVVRVDRDVDAVAVAGERLVDGVVHDLVDQVVQPAHTGRADVHAGALAHGFEALEDGDVLGVVAGARLAGLVGVVCQRVLRVTHTRRPGGRACLRGRGVADSVVIRLAQRSPGTGSVGSNESAAKQQQKSASPGRRAGLRTEPSHGRPPEALVEPLDHPFGEQVELLRPDRGGARDGHDAVALGDRLGLRGERRAGRLGPRALDLREQRRGRQLAR